jgi:DNA helicase-2/ATP-dependent DNA helicase PcrA
MPRSTSKKKKVSTRSKAKATVARKTPSAPKRPATSPSESQDTSTTPGYAIGDRVSHQQFGGGVITALDGEKLTIKFGDGRTKQIIDYYVKRRSK